MYREASVVLERSRGAGRVPVAALDAVGDENHGPLAADVAEVPDHLLE